MKSFRIVDTKFRILSKGRVGIFAAIAVGAMMTIGASTAHADVTLSNSTGNVFYGSTVTLTNSGVTTQITNSTSTGSGDTTSTTATYISNPGSNSALRENSTTSGVYGTLSNQNTQIARATNENYILNSGVTVVNQSLGTSATVNGSTANSRYYLEIAESTDTLSYAAITWAISSSTVGAYTVANWFDARASDDGAWYGGDWNWFSYGDTTAGGVYSQVSGTTYHSSAGTSTFTSVYQYTANTESYNVGLMSAATTYAVDTTGTLSLGGNNTINGDVRAGGITVNGSQSSFNGNVISTNDSGTTLTGITVNGDNNTFNGTVTASNISLSGLNNTFAGAVTSDVSFASAGSASLTTGADLTGNLNFGYHNATFTLSDGSDITGSIGNTNGTNNGSTNGTVNFEKSSVVTGNVGATNNVVDQLNVNGTQAFVHLNSANSGSAVNNTTVNHIDFAANKSVVQVDGLLTANSVDMNGFYSRLDLMDEGSTEILGLSSYTTAANRTTGASTTTDIRTRGMVGTLDFGTYTSTINNVATTTQGKGTLYVGDNVNVNFTGNPATGLTMTNANNATLIFGGDSMVGGYLGTSVSSASTVHTIYAGNTGNTVTIANDVYVGSGNFNVGAGTVNFNGNLNGNLVLGTSAAASSVETSAYSGYGNNIATFTSAQSAGIVNIAHEKSVSGTITTLTNNTGTVNFMGSSSYGSTIGASGAKLAAVTFNSASVGNGTAPGNATNSFTETINNNVYATTVTIGNSGETATTAKATSLVDAIGSYDYAGATNMQVWTGGTVANIGSSVTSLGDNLVISNARDAINLGTAHVAATSFTTNNGAMSFTVNTKDIVNTQTVTDGANDFQGTNSGSGQVAVTTLNMSGSEKIQVNYVGSLKDAGTYNLITASAGASTYSGVEGDGKVSDNSYVIDTKIAKAASGNLILTADRTANTAYAANQLYVEKSNTVGHLSNNAATVLAGIAATGSQTDDMVQVIQKMEIDSFGYGNNQQNLETQVKRLAPIANASLSQSAISANTLTLNTVSNRIADLRGDSIILPNAGRTGMSAGDESAKNGAWVKLIASTATQEQDGMYDGYKTNSRGLAMGIDHKFKYDITAGLAFGYTLTNIDQQDFRDGDTASTKSYNVVAYASKDFERAYVEGALSYAHHNTDSQRVTAVGRVAEGDIDANQYTAHLSAGYRFNVKDKATVTPFLALDYTHLAQDAYTETGAGAINLDVDAMSTNRTTFGGGLRVGTKYDNGATVLRPELKLAAYHISGGSNTDITAQYVGGGEKFVTPGTDLNNMMYNIGLGLKAQVNEATSLGFTVDYDRSSNGLFQGYTGQLVGRYEF